MIKWCKNIFFLTLFLGLFDLNAPGSQASLEDEFLEHGELVELSSIFDSEVWSNFSDAKFQFEAILAEENQNRQAEIDGFLSAFTALAITELPTEAITYHQISSILGENVCPLKIIADGIWAATQNLTLLDNSDFVENFASNLRLLVRLLRITDQTVPESSNTLQRDGFTGKLTQVLNRIDLISGQGLFNFYQFILFVDLFNHLIDVQRAQAKNMQYQLIEGDAITNQLSGYHPLCEQAFNEQILLVPREYVFSEVFNQIALQEDEEGDALVFCNLCVEEFQRNNLGPFCNENTCTGIICFDCIKKLLARTKLNDDGTAFFKCPFCTVQYDADVLIQRLFNKSKNFFSNFTPFEEGGGDSSLEEVIPGQTPPVDAPQPERLIGGVGDEDNDPELREVLRRSMVDQ